MAEFGGSLVDESVAPEPAGYEIELEEAQTRRQSTGIAEA